MELLTFGHGTLDAAQITHLLPAAPKSNLSSTSVWRPGRGGIPRSPGRRWNSGCPRPPSCTAGNRALGGRRKPSPASPNVALRNESFRGYADYMRSTDFWDALDGVLRESAIHRTAIMCSESVYWRCHRRLIADAAVLQRDTAVWHLDHAGRLNAHRLTDGVRSDHGQPVYDVGGSNPLPDL